MSKRPQKKTPVIWALLDDRAGNRSQCLGVAGALGLPYDTFELSYRWQGKLPNFLLGASFSGLDRNCISSLAAPWPDLVIAAGRRSAPVARQIKKLSKGATKIIQVMWPGRKGSDDFDLIAVPNHDGVPERSNVLHITGAPHEMTTEFLDNQKSKIRAKLEHLPEPRIALIVGGSTKNRIFTPEMAKELGVMASDMARSAKGSLLVTTSRRTGKAADALFDAISVQAETFRWDQEGDNPYPAYLAAASAIVVTGDSMSMCSEACGGSGPVYIYAPDTLITPKHKRYHDELFRLGYARVFDGTFGTWQHLPLNSATNIANEIRTILEPEFLNA